MSRNAPTLPTSGSSRDPRPPWAVAGAAWQGRRSAGIPLGFQGSRTPPGGDQRPIQGCRGLREGPRRRLLGRHEALAAGRLAVLERVALGLGHLLQGALVVV